MSRPHRTWPQRALIALMSLMVLLCFASAAGLAYVERRVSDVPRLSFGNVLDEETAAGEPQNILIVGVDDGTGMRADDPVLRGRSKSLNTDTIMVLRVDPGSERASLLSFPRDLWVTIGGTSQKGKINSAMALGGPQRLVQTIQQNFLIDIHHFVMMDLAGFRNLVSAIDGVPIYFPWAARDRNSGFLQDETGCITLEPDQALAYARSRNFEVYDEATKRYDTDPAADLGRITRQQNFIRAALQRAINRGVRNPFTMNQLISVGQESVTFDEYLTTQDIVDLGTQFRDFDPEQLDLYMPPVRGGNVGAASVVFLLEREAQPIFDVFRGVQPESDVIPTVRVEVRNGSGTSGQGRTVLDALADRGFAAVRSSDARSFDFPTTVVLYAPGQELAAAQVARFVDGDPTFQEDATLSEDVSVALVTGADFTAIRAEPRPIEDFQEFLDRAGTSTSVVDPSALVADETTVEQPFVPEAPPGVAC
jgi:LCP family protein required for cell wall assembly